ncbi:alpha-amylase family glycosyl hydrolase [Sphingorhabdus arenilitoris]|uniref:Alpha-amylase family glycosyl hydrolase n=1 Tax=Sphingorhabdus arenilitoris TaxID=1490041 RepID=A0ABV8RIP0_9SPHN
MTHPESAAVKPAHSAHAPWWKGATIYQIYPRSFMDSNGDGIGDLPGITSRLDYVADLGVDAIWLSPFFKSPMHDFGYDVSDFSAVDPIFGSLDDFDALIEKAHKLGLKVIIDQVYSHSSDQHAWFTESRSSRDNEKADWYVWADPKADGSPPNNWQSIFGGPAWAWDARRQQYYFHNFLTQQPDLNLHCPAVQDALLDTSRFWLDRGVDGFRIDAVLHMMHDPALTDNQPTMNNHKVKTRSHDFQNNVYNQGHPAIFDFLSRLRSVTDEYEGRFTVAEVGGTAPDEFMKKCAAGNDRMHSAYSFDFLYAEKLTPDLICSSLAKWEEADGTGWPTWAFENHDAPRAVSRWTGPEYRSAFAQMKMALITMLRGNIILYQGEELGLTQVDIPFELVQDPEALRNWPLTLSRDGARTPMPWEAESHNAGFGSGETWLPLGEDHIAMAVDRQNADAASMLNLTRRLIALRNQIPALRAGNIAKCDAQGDLLELVREHDGTQISCLFNMGTGSIDIAAHNIDPQDILIAPGGSSAASLPAFGFIIGKI